MYVIMCVHTCFTSLLLEASEVWIHPGQIIKGPSRRE